MAVRLLHALLWYSAISIFLPALTYGSLDFSLLLSTFRLLSSALCLIWFSEYLQSTTVVVQLHCTCARLALVHSYSCHRSFILVHSPMYASVLFAISTRWSHIQCNHMHVHEVALLVKNTDFFTFTIPHSYCHSHYHCDWLFFDCVVFFDYFALIDYWEKINDESIYARWWLTILVWSSHAWKIAQDAKKPSQNRLIQLQNDRKVELSIPRILTSKCYKQFYRKAKAKLIVTALCQERFYIRSRNRQLSK